MNLLVSLKQFLSASLIFAAVMTIHLNITGSFDRSSEMVKKDTQAVENSVALRMEYKFRSEKYALNSIK